MRDEGGRRGRETRVKDEGETRVRDEGERRG